MNTSHINRPERQGLTSLEVAKRVSTGHVNASHDRTSRSLWNILKANLFTRINGLLAILCITVLLLESPTDALFGLVIIINSSIGIIQEVRAKRTLDRLAILNAPLAHAVRDGALQDIPVDQVVLDDVLKLQMGDQVPADGTILEIEGLEINEALLTGESEAIVKQVGDRALSGSLVVAGSGYMHVTAVGKDAYAQQITSKVKRFSPARSELIDGINKLLTYVSWALVVLVPLIIWRQLSAEQSFSESVIRSVAAIVGMVPEGLVLITSIAFALAVLKLARRKVLIQQLPAVEGLARVDVLCLDKTGTLTEDNIIFEELITYGKYQPSYIEQVLATFSSNPKSPTLQALHAAFGKQAVLPVASSVAFSPARKWSSISLGNDGHWILGAPEIICTNHPSTLKQAGQIAASGKRVLALMGSKTAPTAQQLPKESQAVALITLAEKIRGDATATLAFFAQQGVALKILSGDNPQTVSEIAKRVGLTVATAFNARQLPSDANELAKILEAHTIFGRVTPDQKQSIIKALQSKGHTVAMVGDGINDALALKDADLGIAMGASAPATKAIAEVVLLDNQFAHLPSVVAEGRRVIANIERIANLFVIKYVYLFCLSLAISLVALPFPFLPRHLTVIESLKVGIPAFFIGLAPNSRVYVPGFLNRVLRFSVPTGLLVGLLVFITYFLTGDRSPEAVSTLTGTVLMIIGTWTLYCLARPLNWWKLILILAMPGLFLGILLTPLTRELFAFSFESSQWGLALLLGSVGSLGIEAIWRLSNKRKASTPSPE